MTGKPISDKYHLIIDSSKILKLLEKYDLIYCDDHLDELHGLLKKIWDLDIKWDVYDQGPLNYSNLSWELEQACDLAWNHGKRLDAALSRSKGE